jgi:hypothetical protein
MASLFATLPAAAGCLVTDSVDFEREPNFPPSIQSRAGAANPLNEVIVRVLEENGTGPIPLAINVLDPNVEQELRLKAFADNDRMNEQLLRTLPPRPQQDDGGLGASPTVRPVTLEVPSAAFRIPGCHRLEVRVSSEFQFERPAEPVLEGDLGTAVWWVFTKNTQTDRVDPSSCPRRPSP